MIWSILVNFCTKLRQSWQKYIGTPTENQKKMRILCRRNPLPPQKGPPSPPKSMLWVEKCWHVPQTNFDFGGAGELKNSCPFQIFFPRLSEFAMLETYTQPSPNSSQSHTNAISCSLRNIYENFWVKHAFLVCVCMCMRPHETKSVRLRTEVYKTSKCVN